MDDISYSLQYVEVEVRVAGNGAVETRLEERGPLFLQHTGGAAAVVLTNSGHPRKDDLEKIRLVRMETIWHKMSLHRCTTTCLHSEMTTLRSIHTKNH